MYKAALAYAEQKDWQSGLALVDQLLQQYPESQDLLRMHNEMSLEAARLHGGGYTQDPLYRAVTRHAEKGKWQSGLTLLDRLLILYPGTPELLDLQKTFGKSAKQASRMKMRKTLVVVLASLVVIFGAVSALFLRYILKPAPIADLVVPPQAKLNLAPHYLFSIYGVDQPVGVGVSQEADRIYVTEMGGARLVKVFDSNGKPLSSFQIPHTQVGERAPVYLAVDKGDHVFVSDRKQHALFIFSRDGAYISTMVSPNMTLAEYVNRQTGVNKVSGNDFSYNLFQNTLYYKSTDGKEQSMKMPYLADWSPLGVRIDSRGYLFLTDVTSGKNSFNVVELPKDFSAISSNTFNPASISIGKTGQGNGELMFPNSAMIDSQGRVYVADGNNGRISVWDRQGKFLYSFGRGAGDGALSLPRGIFIDEKDRLFVVDAVGQDIKVYDVSGTEPVFLYAFGDFGQGDGLFNYPNDIAVDHNGRVYIVDRENNRIQVWTY